MSTLLQQLLELTQPPAPDQQVAAPVQPAPAPAAPAQPAPVAPDQPATPVDDPFKGLTVACHKAYPEKVQEIIQALDFGHSGGAPLKTTEQGDYIHIHLDKTKSFNTPAAIALTLKDYEGTSAYNSSKNIMVNGKSYNAEQD